MSATRSRRRRSIVVRTSDRACENAAVALKDSLSRWGFDVDYLGLESSPRRIAHAVVAARADALELCTANVIPVELIRLLLRELEVVGRADARIVIHRLA